jgi:hypothetical protein
MRWLLSLLIVTVSSLCSAQETKDSTVYEGPFTKGRFVTGLSGSIRSAALSDNLLSSNRRFLEGYQLGTNSGYFFRERMALGINFRVSRDVQESINRIESETLQIGPWFRYYTSKEAKGSVYPEISLQYVNFADNTRSIDNSVNERRLISSGLGVELGVGFTYVISEHIGFDIGLNYFGGFLNGRSTTTGVSGTQQESFYLGQLNFRFGFIAMVDEFFF